MDIQRSPYASLAALLATLLLSATPVRAQLAPPQITAFTGVFHIAFTTPNVVDLSSDWVSHDERGRLSGLLLTTDNEEILIKSSISGACSMSMGVTKVKQRIVTKGRVGNGDTYSAVSNFKGTLEGYGAEAKLVGETDTKTCLKFDYGPFSKKKIVVCNRNIELDQSWNHDGRWSIDLVLHNVGKDLSGGGLVSVGEANPATSKTYGVTVKGRLDPDGEANFKLVPLDKENGVGGTIKLRALMSPGHDGWPPELLEILEVGGKILGQKFAEVY